jgi:hypothetical protein
MTSLESLGSQSLKIHLRIGDQLGLATVRGEYAPGEVLPPELQLKDVPAPSRHRAVGDRDRRGKH